MRLHTECVVLRCTACEPNRTSGTDVSALTLHSTFDLDVELKTKLDLSKVDHEKVKLLLKMEVELYRGHHFPNPDGAPKCPPLQALRR